MTDVNRAMRRRAVNTRRRRVVWLTTLCSLLLIFARQVRADDDDDDDDDDHDDHDHGGSRIDPATCALESDSLTWCTYAGIVGGLDVAYAPVTNDTSTVNHWIRARFSGALNPTTTGWASFGPGRSMSSADVVVGGGTAVTSYTLTNRNTPSTPCASNCPISSASDTSTGTSTEIKFKFVDASSAPGPISFIWGMTTSAWPVGHDSRGVVSVDLTGQGGSAYGGGSHLNRDVAHGVLMALAWLIFMPSASAAALLKNIIPNGMWFNAHLACVGAGSLLFAIALGLLIGRDEHGEDDDLEKHYALGVAVIALWLIQLALGALRPNKNPDEGARLGFIPTALRPLWFLAHRIIAPLVIILAAATCWVGTELMEDRYDRYDSIGTYVLQRGFIFGFFGGIVLIVLFLYFTVARGMSSGIRTQRNNHGFHTLTSTQGYELA